VNKKNQEADEKILNVEKIQEENPSTI